MNKYFNLKAPLIIYFLLIISLTVVSISSLKNSKLVKASKSDNTTVVETKTYAGNIENSLMPKVTSQNFNDNFGKPINITIPDIKIFVKVIDGVYDENSKTWTLDEDAASFATMTALPNAKEGNTLIYAHNTSKLFYNTKLLKEGDIVTLETDKGYFLSYKFENDEIVSPTNTSIFNYKGTPRLTLLTCNGWNDHFRKLMYFSYVGKSVKP